MASNSSCPGCKGQMCDQCRVQEAKGPGDTTSLKNEVDDPATYETLETLNTNQYITKTFKKRVCDSFVPIQDKTNPCQCGYEKNEHPRGVVTNQQKWSVELSTKVETTDAYGVVEFPANGHKTSKYIRVDVKTDVDALWKLMNDHWRIRLPHLLISVTGGAQKLSTAEPVKHAALKEVFRKGLVEAAQSTGAWIITGGTNTGVMKMMGEAIRAHTLKKGSRKQLVAIGIATWGCIKDREKLIVSKRKNKSPADQDTLSKIHKNKSPAVQETLSKEPKVVKETPLDPNHTHFILVDDGTRDRYGAEIKLRAALEEKISKTVSCGVEIPIVCIVIEGGPNTIKTVKEAVSASTPVIIVEGSGRAADVLAYARNKFKEPSTDTHKQEVADEANRRLWEELVQTEIPKALNETDPPGVLIDPNGVLSDIKDCLKHHNIITVFPIGGKGSTESIDYCIITTLLRVKKGETSTLDKMKLALAWDRIDIVKEHTVFYTRKLTADQLKELAFTAIVNNRVEFVKYFLERNLSLGEFLEKYTLNDIYIKAMTKNKHLNDVLKKTKSTVQETLPKGIDTPDVILNLEKLNGFICQLVNGLFNPSKPGISKTEGLQLLSVYPIWTSDDAAVNLFFWSILSGLKSMAVIFLCKAKETFALSLIGHLMLKNLLKVEGDSESQQELQSLVDYFEGLTTGLLTECYSSNQEMTIDLLVRPIPTFDELTPLEIAVQANNQSVLAHQACQNLLTAIWMGRISDDNSTCRTIILCIPPLFLLAPLLLKFRERAAEEREAVRAKEDESYQKNADESSSRKTLENTVNPRSWTLTRTRTWTWARLLYFLTAPCVKFTLNCVSYALFLLLFSIILLTDFFPKISSPEIVLIVWVVTMVFEEIRQMVEGREVGSQNFRNYFSSHWNWMDLIAVSLFDIGLVLRLIPISWCHTCFPAARIVLAFSLMTFYFRILRLCSMFKQLGPKLVMIGQMMIDLSYFMTILLVFIIAYGIAANVIHYPNQELRLALVPDVLRGAWWSVYGEFNIDEVSGQSCEASAYGTHSPEECAAMEKADFNRTVCHGNDGKCPAFAWFGPIFLAIYALITNVLMINLLIAMFSNTFAQVEITADGIWKTQRYHLVLDYESHPFLPPPLIILDHAYRVIDAISRRLRSGLCRKKNRKGTDYTDEKQKDTAMRSTESRTRAFRMTFGDCSERELIAWLKVNVDEYFLKQETEERLAKKTSEGIDQLLLKTEVIGDVGLRLKTIEDQMKKVIELLSAKQELVSSKTANAANPQKS